MSRRTDFRVPRRDLLAEPFHYRACGLDNIYLLNGVAWEDTAYGRMVNIESLNDLHRAIGLHIVEKGEAMSGPEFRFLRKQIRHTQKELANLMNVSEQTIANYEKGQTGLGTAEPFMRWYYLLSILPDETRAELLRSMLSALTLKDKRSKRKLPALTRRKIVGGWNKQEKAAA